MSTHRLVLLRHGQSQWNLEARFTGWADVDLSDEGEREARGPERLLREQRYHMLQPEQVPLTESLRDTVDRVVPFWNDSIAPALSRGRSVLIAAHGNSLRALVKFLDRVSDDDIVGLNIPTGAPLVYELDDALRPNRHFYLVS